MLIDLNDKEVIQLVDSSVKEVSIPDSIIKIRDNAFKNTDIETITIPDSIKEIGVKTFYHCNELKEVQLNCNIEQLPNSIFEDCSSISSFNVPECTKVIGKNAFSGCKNLIELKLNHGIRIIENRAFNGCVNLQSLNIPESVEHIGDTESCFYNCKSLKEIIYNAINAKTTGMPQSVINLTIGSKVRRLCENFLINASDLYILIIPNNVQYIETNCIIDCANLREITISSKDIEIEEGWVRNCRNLRTVNVHVNMYEKILPFIPKGKKIKVKKLYDHHFLLFKW